MDSAPAHPEVIIEPKLLGPHSRDDLLAAYAAVYGDLDAFRAKLNLSDAQFLFFLEDKAIIERRTVIDNSLARRYQTIAAEGHASTIKTSTNPVERRRAAVALGSLVRNWNRFDSASPTAPIKRAAPPPCDTPPDGTAPDGIALPSGASGASAPPRKPKPTSPPPKPLITMVPRQGKHPLESVRFAVHIFRTLASGAHRAAEHLAVQLAPGATLDHKPIPAQAYLDPSILAEFVKDSTLTDIKGQVDVKYLVDSQTPTQFSFRMVPTADHSRTLAQVTATRQGKSLSWFITSISSPNRPPPLPHSGGGVASPRSDGGGASEGPAPP